MVTGFVDTEGVKTSSLTRLAPAAGDAAACARLGKRYAARRGTRVALADVTLGIPPGQVTNIIMVCVTAKSYIPPYYITA